ncbi:MAK10-like protein [Tanacetum coccineum]
MWSTTSSSNIPWYAFLFNSVKNSLLSSIFISSSVFGSVKISAGFALKKDRKLSKEIKYGESVSVTVSDAQYVVFNRSEYAVLIFLSEYAVLDRKLDTPYSMEVDTPYRVIDQNSAQIRRIFLDGYEVLVVRTVIFKYLCLSSRLRVIHRTSVSRPQLKSTQMKDKVVPNNSQVKLKKTEVEDHHRISSISNKTKSVTACNDSLKPELKLLLLFKPKVVPISTRQPKSQANKFVAKTPKKTVASESTIQKSKSYYSMLYEKTSKAWKWWIEQQCPSRYKWVPKTKMKWVPKVRKEDMNTSISPTIDNASRITNGNDLLTGNLGSYLYTVLPFQELNSSLPTLFMLKASPTQATKSYPVGIVKDVEVHIGKLKLLNDIYVIDIKKDLKTSLLVGRGFLATANAVIDCRKAKITVGEGITRSVFGVKGVDLGKEEAPYWTTLGKKESYKPGPSSDGIGAQSPYYARKDFLDCHFPREWEITRDAEINPFKDVLVFSWDKPPKDGDGAWHAKIRIIDPDGEEFTKTLQSIPTTRKLSERESPREIINLDHFYDT